MFPLLQEIRMRCHTSETGPRLENFFHAQLSMNFSLQINMKLTFSYLLAEKISCSAMFSNKKMHLLVIWDLLAGKFPPQLSDHEKCFIALGPGSCFALLCVFFFFFFLQPSVVFAVFRPVYCLVVVSGRIGEYGRGPIVHWDHLVGGGGGVEIDR